MTRAVRVLLTSVMAVTLAACATNPVTGKREFSLMSESQEIQAGQEADQQVRQQMGVYENAQLQQYVERVGMALARVSERPNLPWHFGVADVAAINAFALPGGYVYVTRGILPFLDTEAQLAGVLGHEIGHVAARHAAQQYTRATTGGVGLAALGILVPAARSATDLAGTGLGVLFLKYGRDDELQADQLGVNYAARGGWNPRGVSDMLTTLSRLDQAAGEHRGVPNWLSTHPQPADRVERIERLVTEAEGSNARWKVDRDGYLQAINGVVFGDDPRQGIVRNGQFVHPDLRIALTFPQGWEVNNMPAQVAAKAPDGNAIVLLQLVQKPQGTNVSETASANMRASGLTEVSGGETTINGLPAYVGVYQGTLKDLGDVVVRAAHISHAGRIYLLAGLSPPQVYRQAEQVFARAIESFHQISAAEAAAIKPNRVQVYTARAGDTWQSLAARGGDAVKPATLAIMNDHDPAEAPRAGERLKIVVGG